MRSSVAPILLIALEIFNKSMYMHERITDTLRVLLIMAMFYIPLKMIQHKENISSKQVITSALMAMLIYTIAVSSMSSNNQRVIFASCFSVIYFVLITRMSILSKNRERDLKFNLLSQDEKID